MRKKPYPLEAAHSFKQDLINAIKVGISMVGSAIFPLKGDVSLLVEVSSTKSLLLYGVLKNAMDACNRLLVTDDVHFSSVHISMLDNPDGESVELWLLSGRTIYSIDADLSDLKAQAMFHVKVTTVPEDRYLPIPREVGDKASETYVADDETMRGHITSSYGGPILSGHIGVSLKMNVEQGSGDIDNLGLSIIKNLDGIVLQDLHDIKVLHMVRTTIPTEDTSVIMALYTLDDLY